MLLLALLATGCHSTRKVTTVPEAVPTVEAETPSATTR